VTQKVEAVYTRGVLKPTRPLPLRDKQRVRLTVETIDAPETPATGLSQGVRSRSTSSQTPRTASSCGKSPLSKAE